MFQERFKMHVNQCLKICSILFLYGLICAAGCDSSKTKTGKFNEEQMKNFPLAKRKMTRIPAGGFVLSVGEDTITADEIADAFNSTLTARALVTDKESFYVTARPAIGDMVKAKVVDILLYEQAKNEASDSIDEKMEQAIRTEVDSFVARHDGNYAEAEKTLKSEGKSWQQYRDQLKKIILMQSYIQQKIPEDMPVTHGEMIDYYDQLRSEKYHWEGYIEFRLIDIKTDQIAPNNPAIEKAKQIVQMARGGHDFAKLAKEYSQGHKASVGGLWEKVTTGNLASPYDVIESQAQHMAINQISEPIKTDGHIFIIQLEDKKEAGSIPFDQVQDEIEADIKRIKKRVEFEKMYAKLLEQANISNMEGFVNYCVELAFHKASIRR